MPVTNAERRQIENIPRNKDTYNIISYYQHHDNANMRDKYRRWMRVLNNYYLVRKMKVGERALRHTIKDNEPEDDVPTARFVSAYIRSQLSNQLFNPLAPSSKVGHVRGKFPGHRLQIDTCFFGKKNINETNNYRGNARVAIGAITCIDVATRAGFALPVISTDSRESANVIIGRGGGRVSRVCVKNYPRANERKFANVPCLLKQVEDYYAARGFPDFHIKLLSTDKGTEFEGEFKRRIDDMFLDSDRKDYKHIYSHEGRSASQGIVERFNLTLRRLLNKLVRVKQDGSADMRNWNAKLQDAVDIYNSMRHSTTKFAPINITPQNIEEAVANTEGKWLKGKFTHHKISAGDYVRLRDFNQSKRKQEISFSWKGTELTEFINRDDEPVNGLDLAKYRGVFVVQSVHGKANITGEAESYGLVNVWYKQGGILARVRADNTRRVTDRGMNVFQGLQYRPKSVLRKFAQGDVLRLRTKLVKNDAHQYRTDMPVDTIFKVLDINKDVRIRNQVADVDAPDTRGARAMVAAPRRGARARRPPARL